MTTFHDGPAHGKILGLRRAPRFLRVVIKPNGEIDALDQLDDTPERLETIHAYEVFGQVGGMHVRASKGGGFYTIAEYRHVHPQPTDAEMRTTAAWHTWTEAHQ